MWVIRQDDMINVTIPVKFRGMKESGSDAPWGMLHENIRDVIPFASTKENKKLIDNLIKAMYKKALSEEHLDNFNKLITVLDVDGDYHIMKEYPLSIWFDKSNKLEW